MKTQLKLASLVALTAATLALPVAAQDSTAPAKCAPVVKCGAKCAPKCHPKKHPAAKTAKCAAKKCAPKCGPKCAPKN